MLERSKRNVFDYIRERTIKKIRRWKAKFLNAAGKEVMIKSVIQVLPVYIMSCFRLPKSICQEISRQIANFCWNNGEHNRKLHWIA